MHKISDINFNIIIKYVNLLCPNKRKPKFTAIYYLTNILDMLTDFVSWKSLTKSNKLVGDKKYHYKTIADIHHMWCNKGVYKCAHEEITTKKVKAEIADEDVFDILIDSTLIANKNGAENIGYGGESKKKKFTKITAITTVSGNIVALHEHKTQTKVIPDKFKVNKILKISTHEHDTNAIIPAVIKARTIEPTKAINVIGDKGYIINENKQKELAKHNAIMIAAKRNNQKIKNTDSEKQKLKGRYKVENFFSKIKAYNRIQIRRDRIFKNFMGFVYLATIYIA